MPKQILILFLWLPALTYAQHNAKYGEVIDAGTREVLASVIIKGSPSGVTTITDSKGRFNAKSTDDSVTVALVGYTSQKIQLSKGGLTSISLVKTTIQLQDITIHNGLRLDTYKLLSAIDLNMQPVRSAQDLLRLVPGLFIAQHMGGGKAEQIFLRGFDADHGTDVHIDVDGMPVNMVTHAHGQGYADMHFLIPELVASYDFGKGPYYADKGDFTTAGFVAYNTKNSLPENMVKVETGRYDSYRGLIMLNLLDEQARKKGENAYIAGEGLFSNGGPFAVPEHFNRINLFAKYSRRVGNGDLLTASISEFHSKWRAAGEIPDRAVQEGYIANRFGSIDSAQGGVTNRQNLNVKLCSTLNSNWSLENQVWFSHYDFNLLNNFSFFNYFPVTGDEFRQIEKRLLGGYNGKVSNTSNRGAATLTSDAGIGFRYDYVSPLEMDHTRNGDLLEHLRLDRAKEQNGNAWLNESLNLGHWLFNVGMRFDYFHFADRDLLSGNGDEEHKAKTAFSPKINVAYNFNDQWQLYLKTGKGFHSNDARAVLANNGVAILPAAYGADLGVNLKPSKNLYINAAAWYLLLDQEFVFGQDLSDQLDGPVSPSGRTARLGGDVSIRYQLSQCFYANLNANVSRGRYLDSLKGHDRIALAPTFTSTAGLDFRFKNGIYGGLSYRYLHDRPGNSDNSLTARGYFVTDATLNYHHKKYEIGVSVENLFNVNWDESQFDDTSQLRNESQPVEQISYTPGTPFFPKLKLTIFF